MPGREVLRREKKRSHPSVSGLTTTGKVFLHAQRLRACILLIAIALTCTLPPSALVQSRSRPRQDSSEQKESGARPSTTPPEKSVAKSLPSPTPTSREEQAVDDGEVVTVNSSEVLLPVTVRDEMGGIVKELSKDDFRVWEDGREQPLSDLALRQVPVDVLLMVDSSSSVASNFEDFRRAVEQFAARLAPEDRVGLLKFDDKVELLLDWTRSRAQLRRALQRVSPGVFTRFNDALYLAAREQFRKGQRRHAVVILSDGIDSGRGYATIETALRALLESQVAVYVISNSRIERARKKAELDSILAGTESTIRFNELKIGDLQEGLRVLDLSERNLEQLARATGGRLYKPDSFNDLDGVYTEVAEELRYQYALYYTPLNNARDGNFRRVEVQTSGPTYQVTTRVGYFAPRN